MSFIVFVAAKLLGALEVEYYAFQTSMVSLVLYLVLAVPFMMLAIGVLLSPMVIYLWLDSPSFRMIHQWWFWVHVIVAILAGAGLLSVAGKKYPKRDEY